MVSGVWISVVVPRVDTEMLHDPLGFRVKGKYLIP